MAESKRSLAEQWMEKYEELKELGYVIETREAPAKIVVYRDGRVIGYAHSFVTAVRLAVEDLRATWEAEHPEDVEEDEYWQLPSEEGEDETES